MPHDPFPPHIEAFLNGPRPAVVATLRRDGTPVTAGTWYGWRDGRIILVMDAGSARERKLRHDPRVALTIFGDSWYQHVSLNGRVVDLYQDAGLADIDALSQAYRGVPYARSDGDALVTAVIEVESWRAYGDPGGTAAS
jgi:PPOX class probable F420-dependent enzyme